MLHAFSALLAQGAAANPDAAGVGRLPSPPWIESTLFESPWTGMVVLGAAGAVLFWWFNRMQQGRTGAIVLGAALAAAAGLFLTARFVTTERERLMNLTETLVATVAKADVDRLPSLLAPDVRVMIFGRDRGFTAQSLPRWVDNMMRPGTGMYAIRDYSVGEIAATIDGPNVARTQCRVRVTAESYPITSGSWWRITWRKDGAGAGSDAWKVTQIDVLQLDQVPEGGDVSVQGGG